MDELLDQLIGDWSNESEDPELTCYKELNKELRAVIKRNDNSCLQDLKNILQRFGSDEVTNIVNLCHENKPVIFTSIKYRNFEVLDYLLKDCGACTEVYMPYHKGPGYIYDVSPLFYAALLGDMEIVKYFISKGADVFWQNREDRMPIHGAIHKDHLEIVEHLFDCMGEVDLDNSATMFSFLPNEKMFNYLLSKGLDPNRKNLNGSTSLHEAIMLGNTSIDDPSSSNYKTVMMLVQAGADVNIKDYDGLDAVLKAAKEEDEISFRFLSSQINADRNSIINGYELLGSHAIYSTDVYEGDMHVEKGIMWWQQALFMRYGNIKNPELKPSAQPKEIFDFATEFHTYDELDALGQGNRISRLNQAALVMERILGWNHPHTLHNLQNQFLDELMDNGLYKKSFYMLMHVRTGFLDGDKYDDRSVSVLEPIVKALYQCVISRTHLIPKEEMLDFLNSLLKQWKSYDKEIKAVRQQLENRSSNHFQDNHHENTSEIQAGIGEDTQSEGYEEGIRKSVEDKDQFSGESINDPDEPFTDENAQNNSDTSGQSFSDETVEEVIQDPEGSFLNQLATENFKNHDQLETCKQDKINGEGSNFCQKASDCSELKHEDKCETTDYEMLEEDGLDLQGKNFKPDQDPGNVENACDEEMSVKKNFINGTLNGLSEKESSLSCQDKTAEVTDCGVSEKRTEEKLTEDKVCKIFKEGDRVCGKNSCGVSEEEMRTANIENCSEDNACVSAEEGGNISKTKDQKESKDKENADHAYYQSVPEWELTNQLDSYEQSNGKIFDCSLDVLCYIAALSRDKNSQLNEEGQALLRRYIVEEICGCNGESILHRVVKCLSELEFTGKTSHKYVTRRLLSIVLDSLLHNGVSVDIPDSGLNRPLHYALKLVKDKENINNVRPNSTIQKLLRHGAHIDFCNEKGECTLDILNKMDFNPEKVKNTTLQCLAATAIMRYGLKYKGEVPQYLETFIVSHDNNKYWKNQ